MRKDLKYISILVFAVLLFVVMEIITPKPIDWTVSLSSYDKDPFGTFLFNERVDDLFGEVSKSNLTIYELQDSSLSTLLVIAQNFNPSEEDVEELLKQIDGGGQALIAADFFYGKLADTLEISTADYLFQGDIFKNLAKEDTAALHFSNKKIDNKSYYYQRNNTQYYFNKFDSAKTVVMGTNDLNRPTFIRMPIGKGNIYLCSTPLVFTNNYMVYKSNSDYVSNVMSYLPEKNVHWTEYYQLGRMEARTPLRFILSNPSLKWAYYVSLATLLIFIVFEAKRKQRIIPIIKPLRNNTLDFVGTIGNLYYQNKAHKSIAEKKINFFMDQLRQQYLVSVKETDADFIEKIAQKTQNESSTVRALFELIYSIKKQKSINEQQLMELNKKIEAFKLNE